MSAIELLRGKSSGGSKGGCQETGGKSHVELINYSMQHQKESGCELLMMMRRMEVTVSWYDMI